MIGSCAFMKEVIPMDNKATVRDYGNMEMKDLIETIIRDSKIQGTITYPLRTTGYHTSSNLVLTDRIF